MLSKHATEPVGKRMSLAVGVVQLHGGRGDEPQDVVVPRRERSLPSPSEGPRLSEELFEKLAYADCTLRCLASLRAEQDRVAGEQREDTFEITVPKAIDERSEGVVDDVRRRSLSSHTGDPATSYVKRRDALRSAESRPTDGGAYVGADGRGAFGDWFTSFAVGRRPSVGEPSLMGRWVRS
jgi:hypothetical protein